MQQRYFNRHPLLRENSLRTAGLEILLQRLNSEAFQIGTDTGYSSKPAAQLA
jgi:hypothetical protein